MNVGLMSIFTDESASLVEEAGVREAGKTV
jgi:hypothetical protein